MLHHGKESGREAGTDERREALPGGNERDSGAAEYKLGPTERGHTRELILISESTRTGLFLAGTSFQLWNQPSFGKEFVRLARFLWRGLEQELNRKCYTLVLLPYLDSKHAEQLSQGWIELDEDGAVKGAKRYPY